MDLMIRNYIERASSELILAEFLARLSGDADAKEQFKLGTRTFYSSVISHAYYSIFYAAKALLLTKGIKTSSPDIHRKTYEAFEKEFVESGILDLKLLEIYRKLVIRADALLEIFYDEKWKRGHFTYRTVPQANQEPALDSVKNGKVFVSNVIKVIESTS